MGLKDSILIDKLREMKILLENTIKTKGRKGVTSLIRSKKLIAFLHEYIKEELIAQGINNEFIYPPLKETKPEISLAGYLKYKSQDIMIISDSFKEETIKEGVLINDIDLIGKEVSNNSISINVRSQLSSIAKNFDTLYERTFAETLNLHLRLNKLVCGEVYLIPIIAYDDELMTSNQVAFREKLPSIYIKSFQALNNRNMKDEVELYKYERVCLLVVDFRQNPPKIFNDVQEIVKEGIFSEKDAKNISLRGLTIGDFVSDILKIYEERHGSLKSLKKELRQKEIKF